MINVYIHPSSTKPDRVLWDHVLEVVDSLPPVKPLILVGSMNAHITGEPLCSLVCPLHGEECHTLPGSTCSRGCLVAKTPVQYSLQLLNGCQQLQAHTCTMLQWAGMTTHSTVDLMVLNHPVL